MAPHGTEQLVSETCTTGGFNVTDSASVVARYYDRVQWSPRTARSAHVTWRRHVFLYPLAYLAWRIGFAPAELLWHFQASIEQKDMYCSADNLLMFGHLIAKKPRSQEAVVSMDNRSGSDDASFEPDPASTSAFPKIKFPAPTNG